jgi:hypothetical protein
MYHFSEETLTVLKKNGWTEDRHVDITDYEAYFAETQQPVSDIIREFLRSFGGIEAITYNKQFHIEIDLFRINPRLVGCQILHVYAEKWIQKPLCGVGESDNDIFAMTPEGESFVIFDAYVFKIGNTVEEAVETLCTDGPRERIVDPGTFSPDTHD